MAGLIHQQLWILGSVKSSAKEQGLHQHRHLLWKDPLHCDSMLGPSNPDCQCKVTMEALWIEALLNPWWVCEELQGRLAQDNEPFEHVALSLVDAVRDCAKNKDLYRGSTLHDDILKQGLLEHCSDALVVMYAKCGALAKANELLDMCKSRDVVAWNALISGYTQVGQGEQALNCFERMRRVGLSPNAATFACILKACGSIGAIEKGERFHDQIYKRGLLKKNVVLGSALVDMYVKCGALTKAQRVLEKLPSRNVITWSSLITGYAQQGKGEKALECFERMQHEGLSPNAVTFACILKACGSVGVVDKGEQIHDEITRQGLLENDAVLGTALVDMYAKCGALEKAHRVLKELPSQNVTTWNALIAGYVQQDKGEQALNFFEQMQQEGLSPNAVTFACILKACGSMAAIEKGEQMHDEIVRQGLLRTNIVLGSALVDMYSKCGDLTKAERVLEDLPSRNVITWSALITGYAQQGQGEQALRCFERMQREGLSPDAVIFSCVLNACSHLGLVEDGHRYFLRMSRKYGLKPDLKQYACLVDLFGRAGHLDKAVEVIQEMPCPDYPAVWSALLGACHKWRDVNVGRWAFERAIQVDKRDAALYVLMANMYSVAGMQEEAEIIEARRKENEAYRRIMD